MRWTEPITQNNINLLTEPHHMAEKRKKKRKNNNRRSDFVRRRQQEKQGERQSVRAIWSWRHCMYTLSWAMVNRSHWCCPILFCRLSTYGVDSHRRACMNVFIFIYSSATIDDDNGHFRTAAFFVCRIKWW